MQAAGPGPDARGPGPPGVPDEGIPAAVPARGVRLGQAIDLRIEGSSPSNDARYSLRSRFIFPAMPA